MVRSSRYAPLRSSLPAILLLLLLIGLAAWPALRPGALLNTRGGGDSPFLLQRTQQMVTALRDGHFPVRWMRDANYGYGYPFFSFYAPLSIYISAGFSLLGLSTVTAIQLAQLAGFAVAAGATYLLARRWWEPERAGLSPAGLLAAAAYTLAPFHLVNVYVRGDSLAEFWAMAFYPLTLLAADGLFDGKRPVRAAAWLALAYAGLVLCHNISALIFSPFLGLYLALRWWQKRADSERPRRRMVLVAGALLLGLALSAWFWLPALGERGLAQLEPVTSGYFHYSNHFRGADLVQPSFRFDYGISEGADPFRMGLVQAVAVALGLLGLIVRRNHQPGSQRTLFLLVLVVGATFMITPLSRWLWDALPLLPFTQFPWRFLSIQAFGGALAAVGLLALWPGRQGAPVGQLGVAALVTITLLVAALGNLRPDYLRLTEADVTPVRLAEYEWFTGNIGSTVSAEYLPPWVAPRPWTSAWLVYGQRHDVRVLSGAAETSLVRFETARQEWRVSSGSDGARLLFPTLYWPGWQALVDGAKEPLEPAPGSGLTVLSVPAGEHTVTLRLARTPVRLAGELLSLGALALTLGLLWHSRDGLPDRRWAAALGAVLALAIVARLWPEAEAPGTPLTWDFAQLGYLHHAEGAVQFDNGATLASYEFLEDEIAAGGAFRANLRWGEAVEPARLSLVGPTAFRPGAPGAGALAPLAQDDVPAETGEVRTVLTVPADASPGLYLPALTFPDAFARTPSGLQRGLLALHPLRVVPAAQTAPPSHRLIDAQLHEGGVTAGSLQLTLAWWTEEQLTHNLGVSVRVMDRTGAWQAQFDTQPGYGYLPSQVWPARTWVPDRLAISLETVSPADAPFDVLLQLYDVPTGNVRLTRNVGELAMTETGLAFGQAEPSFQVPTNLEPLDLTFGPGDGLIALRGFRLEQDDHTVDLTLVWQSLAPTEIDFRHFVHLIDPASGAIQVQDDAMPRRNAYPTSQWVSGEVVEDPLTLDLETVPPGVYQVAVGLYEARDGEHPRLSVFTADGDPVADQVVWLPVSVTVTPP